MEEHAAVDALGALAQHTRLRLVRHLIQLGPAGAAAGELAERFELAPATLSFHLSQLAHTGLVTWHREGRRIIYAASYDRMRELMAYLWENCCGGERRCAPSAWLAPSESERTS